MICKELTDVLCDYIEGVLDPETHEELEEHFRDCLPCTAFFNTYKKTSHLCRQSLEQIEVPTALEEKLKYFVRNRMNKAQ